MSGAKDMPYPADHYGTHWEGCYRERRHHNCAVEMVDHLSAYIAALEERLDMNGIPRPKMEDGE